MTSGLNGTNIGAHPTVAAIQESWTARYCMRLAMNNNVLGIREEMLRRLKTLARQQLTNDWPDNPNPWLDGMYCALRLDGFNPEEAAEYIAVARNL